MAGNSDTNRQHAVMDSATAMLQQCYSFPTDRGDFCFLLRLDRTGKESCGAPESEGIDMDRLLGGPKPSWLLGPTPLAPGPKPSWLLGPNPLAPGPKPSWILGPNPLAPGPKPSWILVPTPLAPGPKPSWILCPDPLDPGPKPSGLAATSPRWGIVRAQAQRDKGR